MKLVPVDEIIKTNAAGIRLPHDERYEAGSAFVHGEYCPLLDAKIPLRDMGFTQSDATYEKATVSRGNYFRLQDHFDRFARSCEKLRLRNPHSNEQMVEIFDRLLSMTGFREAGVFWCVTRGLGKKASDRNNPDIFENRFYVMVDAYTQITTPEQRIKGLDLLISKKYIRVPPRAVDPTAKNFHWLDMKLSLFEARDEGKDWAVLTDAEGYLTEAVGANIFHVKDGVLYTPDSGCLEGITRLATLELAEMLQIPIRETKIHAKELLGADEAFITSSAGGIMPVNSVDGVVFGGIEGPGEVTTRLHNLYWEKMWDGWKTTPVNYNKS